MPLLDGFGKVGDGMESLSSFFTLFLNLTPALIYWSSTLTPGPSLLAHKESVRVLVCNVEKAGCGLVCGAN